MLDKTKSLEVQAKQAFNMRNEIRTATRHCMKDQDIAEFLDELEPNKTWLEMIEYTKHKKGKQGDEVWREIIKSSMKGRDTLNEVFKLPMK